MPAYLTDIWQDGNGNLIGWYHDPATGLESESTLVIGQQDKLREALAAVMLCWEPKTFEEKVLEREILNILENK